MNETQDESESPTLAARLTPELPAAIATIAVRGPRALQCVSALAKFKGETLRVGQIRYGTWKLSQLPIPAAQPSAPDVPPTKATSPLAEQIRNSTAAHVFEEQVVLCRVSEDQIEINCHGGQAVCAAILNSLANHNCQVVSAADWPSLHTCPLRVVAEQDLIRATTDKAARVLLDQFNGALSREIVWIAEQLEAGDTDLARSHLVKLLEWSDLGVHLVEPFQVVLAGPPNVGKSSLLNAIAGRSRSIVHEEAGTTRDWIESAEAFCGWPVSVTDTAGLRGGTDEIEKEGVRRAHERIALADLLVLVVDATCGWTETHAELVATAMPRQLVAVNKVDLLDSNSLAAGQLAIPVDIENCISTSATTPEVNRLIEAIARALIPNDPPAATAVPFRVSQVQSLQAALESLEKNDLPTAIHTLRHMLVPWIEPGEAS